MLVGLACWRSSNMTSCIGRVNFTRMLMHCHEDHVELGAVLLRLHLSLSKPRILWWRCQIRTSRRLSLTLYRCLRKSRVRRHGHPSWLQMTHQTNRRPDLTIWCGQSRSCVLPCKRTRTSRWSRPGCHKLQRSVKAFCTGNSGRPMACALLCSWSFRISIV